MVQRSLRGPHGGPWQSQSIEQNKPTEADLLEVGNDVNKPDVEVIDGYFTVDAGFRQELLDFGHEVAIIDIWTV